MLPNVDSVNQSASSDAVQSTRLAEAQRSGVKAVDVVSQNQDSAAVTATKKKAETDRLRKPEQTEQQAVLEKATETKKATEIARKEKSEVRTRREKDEAELSLTLNAEEKDVFKTAFSSPQGAASLSPEEKDVLKNASERIAKVIEDAIAKRADNKAKVEAALSEWYAKMTKGERIGPTDLIDLMRQAAMGKLPE